MVHKKVDDMQLRSIKKDLKNINIRSKFKGYHYFKVSLLIYRYNKISRNKKMKVV